MMGEIADAVEEAMDRLKIAHGAVLEAEELIKRYDDLPSDTIELWARVRSDGTINSQTLRVSREGAESAARWGDRGKLVRLICKVVPV